MHWIHNDAWHYLCSMPSVSVTPCLIFGRKGKKTAWKVWMAFNDVTEAFCDLARYKIFYCPFVQFYNFTADKPSSINESINLLERFIVLL